MIYDFYKRLEIVGASIPAGRVATYGQLAMLCGKPKNARQVGYALRKNRLDDTHFAYRIINGKGYLSGSKAFATPDLQKKMLKQDGVFVDMDNRVDLDIYQWLPSLDEVYEFNSIFKSLNI